MDRAQQHHRARLGEAIRAELITIIEGELADPRIGAVSVSEVHMTPDGKTIIAFISAAEDDESGRRSVQVRDELGGGPGIDVEQAHLLDVHQQVEGQRRAA